MRKPIVAILGSLLFLSVLVTGFTTHVTAQYGYGDEVPEHCDNPTVFRNITAAPSGQDSDLSFDKEVINVPKNTCVEITFYNEAPTVEHDFVIDPKPGSDGINFVDIHLLNGTAGPYNNGTDTFNVMTPNADVTFEFYCSIGNHYDAGMKGDFIVGDGGEYQGEGYYEEDGILPGFTSLLVAFTLFSTVLIIRIRKH